MPINESQKFLEAFKGFEDHYILIGGTATSIVLTEYNIESRATRDYDIVIMDEKKDQHFFNVVTKFLEEGGYAPSILDREGKLYRFSTSKDGYPKMIELFCVRPHWLTRGGQTAPVHFDEEMSLSALLLDQDYYDLLEIGRTITKGYSVLNNVYLIIFKAKAWLDLNEKRSRGMQIDSKNIKKHLNDIARLTSSIKSTEKVFLPENVQEDMCKFLDLLEKNIAKIPQNKDILLDRQGIFDLLNAILNKS